MSAQREGSAPWLWSGIALEADGAGSGPERAAFSFCHLGNSVVHKASVENSDDTLQGGGVIGPHGTERESLERLCGLLMPGKL